ncbi:MAG TPA: translesion error-prone DNA polymerase V autoproteolytic subunit [Chitinophagaceae bacterium]|nr:translesion error-prone DNA polymerase V autoproteolytic subunit [Chitinophagaceae bacterium]
MQVDKYFSARYTGSKSMTRLDIHSANATGFGAAADDYMERGIDLNEELVRNKPATFFMRVSSDAMREAGIYKGDIAIVDRSIRATNGKVVIAVLNGDMLIRRFEKINNHIKLIADASRISPVTIDSTCEDFAIWGVVTYVIHTP